MCVCVCVCVDEGVVPNAGIGQFFVARQIWVRYPPVRFQDQRNVVASYSLLNEIPLSDADFREEGDHIIFAASIPTKGLPATTHTLYQTRHEVVCISFGDTRAHRSRRSDSQLRVFSLLVYITTGGTATHACACLQQSDSLTGAVAS